MPKMEQGLKRAMAGGSARLQLKSQQTGCQGAEQLLTSKARTVAKVSCAHVPDRQATYVRETSRRTCLRAAQQRQQQQQQRSSTRRDKAAGDVLLARLSGSSP